MKIRKMKARASLFLLSMMALVMAMGTVIADPLTGVEGETQSMIIIG